MTNIIHLPDPRTGESVELHVPEDCPYFEKRDSVFISQQPNIKWNFCAFGFKFPLDDSLVHALWFSERFPIIAAVAAEWWMEKASQLKTFPNVYGLYADNWRIFTAKPKEGK